MNSLLFNFIIVVCILILLINIFYYINIILKFVFSIFLHNIMFYYLFEIIYLRFEHILAFGRILYNK